MNIFCLLLIIAIDLILGVSSSAAYTKQIRLVSYENPPFSGKDLKDQGAMTAIIKEAYIRKGYQVKIDFKDLQMATVMAKQGKYDGIFPFWYKKRRKEWGQFSTALPNNELGFFYLKKNQFEYNEIKDLIDLTVGYVKSYYVPAKVRNFSGAKFKVAESYGQNMKWLIKGDIDVAIGDRWIGMYTIQESFPGMEMMISWSGATIHTRKQFILFSKGSKKLKSVSTDFNESFKEMVADGSLEKILVGFGFDQN
ncbi:MAG: hypothetical protein CMP10_19340 [Zetaproteobacteria bacterium]|nr:hypothetical protein [Pseudobdellovibrionaceae bacterium]